MYDKSQGCRSFAILNSRTFPERCMTINHFVSSQTYQRNINAVPVLSVRVAIFFQEKNRTPQWWDGKPCRAEGECMDSSRLVFKIKKKKTTHWKLFKWKQVYFRDDKYGQQWTGQSNVSVHSLTNLLINVYSQTALVNNVTSPCLWLTSMILQLVTLIMRYNHTFNARFSLNLLQSTNCTLFVYFQHRSADFSDATHVKNADIFDLWMIS